MNPSQKKHHQWIKNITDITHMGAYALSYGIGTMFMGGHGPIAATTCDMAFTQLKSMAPKNS